jgi:hypothetical protein
VDVWIQIFLTSVLVGGKWSASRPCRFTPGEKALGTHWVGGWVGPRADLDDVEKTKFLTLPGLELRTLGCAARSQALYRLRYPGSRLSIGYMRWGGRSMKLTIHLEIMQRLSFYISSCLSIETTFTMDPIQSNKLRVTAVSQRIMKHAGNSEMWRDFEDVKACSEKRFINVVLFFFKCWRVCSSNYLEENKISLMWEFREGSLFWINIFWDITQCNPKRRLDFTGLHGFISEEIKFLLNTDCLFIRRIFLTSRQCE